MTFRHDSKEGRGEGRRTRYDEKVKRALVGIGIVNTPLADFPTSQQSFEYRSVAQGRETGRFQRVRSCSSVESIKLTREVAGVD
jgi:hypothetical protein